MISGAPREYRLGTQLPDKFYRLNPRRGYKRAAAAIAQRILAAIYHLFSQQVSYNDLGDLYLDMRDKNHLTRRATKRPSLMSSALSTTPITPPSSFSMMRQCEMVRAIILELPGFLSRPILRMWQRPVNEWQLRHERAQLRT